MDEGDHTECPIELLACPDHMDEQLRRMGYEPGTGNMPRRSEGVAGENFFKDSDGSRTVGFCLWCNKDFYTQVLLYRSNLDPQDILKELDKLEAGEDNRFTGTTEWIGNNFVGALLLIYEPHSRPCPFYAGFRTFCRLARANLRHLLELCHKSIYAKADTGQLTFPISTEQQAEAARQASAAFLGEIKSFGRQGNRLHTFVHRLGTLFQLAHQRPTQSEPEQSHFSVGTGTAQLVEDDIQFLNEAVKWSVLFEEEGTKKKDKYEPEAPDYVLNPIYAPYFHISYRKKRKLELKTDDVITLIRGNFEEVRAMLARFSRSWDVSPEQIAPTLFQDVSSEPQ